jgi:hypothetical protein
MFGEEETQLKSENYVYLKNVKNDYESASFKQNLGLKYIYDNYNFKYVFVCGSDTFINIPKMLLFLKTLNYEDNLYIGGHGDYRTILNEKLYFHSGGPGIVLSKGCMDKIHSRLVNLFYWWEEICTKMNDLYFLTACDVCLAYLLQLDEINSTIITNNNFYHCNYRGIPCCYYKITVQNIITCHSMSSQDFDNFYLLLLANNFFIK